MAHTSRNPSPTRMPYAGPLAKLGGMSIGIQVARENDRKVSIQWPAQKFARLRGLHRANRVRVGGDEPVRLSAKLRIGACAHRLRRWSRSLLVPAGSGRRLFLSSFVVTSPV